MVPRVGEIDSLPNGFVGVEKRRNGAALQNVAELPRAVVRLRFGVRSPRRALFLLHRSLPSELGGLADC